MNEKEIGLNRILDIVVQCCNMEADGQLVTRERVIGPGRNENLVMTRCILVKLILKAGYSTATAAALLRRTQQAVRHLLQLADDFHKMSSAYRMAESEANRRCEDVCK